MCFIALVKSSLGASTACALPLLLLLAAVAQGQETAVVYNRDIRPLLSDRCYQCHGPDAAERQAGLRLDQKEPAMSELESGGVAIAAGDVQQSKLIQRITAEDPAMRMPPPDSGKALSADEIELLKRWVAQGASWEQHWAFVAPQRPPLPQLKDASWTRNAIDYFVLGELGKAQLTPAAEADKRALIRRVTLDLTGLPPTLEEVEQFLADRRPDAYERLVDRLLASPRYGEHRARMWLDAARYGDTHGLHLDNERSIWPYREWVIDAFNRNMPYDEFTVEQLAGDLLPEPTLDQLVATGFNRCNVTTSEGGSIDAEYLVRYAVDRVETTSTVWMGLTTGCAACHDHKFDPISQQEFYQLFAFFYSLTEQAMDKNALTPPPTVEVPTAEQKELQTRYRDQIAAIEGEIAAELAKIEYTDPLAEQELAALEAQDFVWIDDALPEGAQPEGDDGSSSWQFVSAPEHPVHSGRHATRRQAAARSQHFFTGASSPLRIGEGDVLFAYVYLSPEDPPQQIMLQFNDGSWDHRAYWGADLIDWGTPDTPSRRARGPLPETGKWVRLEVPVDQVGLAAGSQINGWAFTQYGGTVYWDTAGVLTRTPQQDERFESLRRWEQVQRSTKASLPKPIQAIVDIAEQERSEQQQKELRDYFLQHVYAGTRERFEPLHAKLDERKKQLDELQKQIPVTLVMEEMDKPREAFVLHRGQYDQPREKVEPGVPAILPPLPEGAPANRLGLARWLVDPSHPLTARVTVNRFWQQYFGTGLVKTAEDFGSQGEWPSHPELLDWLALELIETGWDVKRLQRLIVTSATYRQSSHVTPEKYQKDPENRLLARGPRFRLDAEVIRDQALAVSGLMVGSIGGKSVKPYQPPGLWEAVGYTDSNTARFKRDDGAALYRRSLYTFWKRTSPPPSMSIFDAPTREACTVRRSRTNTPLQALVLMNDEQFVEAARHLARRTVIEAGQTPQERVRWVFQTVLARLPDAEETDMLLKIYQRHLDQYRSEPEAAQQLLSVGASPPAEEPEAAELAAWTMIANLVLNLNETVTKG